MEEVITEKKQTNSNISLDNIYNAVRYLKPEQQGIILENYKLTELYGIFENQETYEKYISDLFTVAKEYSDRAIALISLHTEAFLQSMKKQEEFDPAIIICQMFDCMSETDQKRFCWDIFQKKGFFEESVKMIQAWFDSAKEVQKDDVGD